MKKQNIIPSVLIFFLMLGLIGCDKSDEEVFVQEVALEGALYIGQPLAVRLSYTVPIEQKYIASEQTVNDANVKITVKDGASVTVYSLPEDSSKPGLYTLPDTSVKVTTGLGYSIVVRTIRKTSGDSLILTAETVAAAPLRLQHVSYQGIYDSAFHADPSQFRDPSRMDTIEHSKFFSYFVNYNTDPIHNVGYNMVIENLDLVQDSVNDWESRQVSTQSVGGGIPVSATFERSLDSMEVYPVLLPYWGRTRARVFSCDQPWWDYVSTTRLGQAENYPQSNVKGGYGVFCAIGADTAYFYLVDRISDK